MTNEEAVRILVNMGDYVEQIEDVGICFRSPLVDASLMAIKALRNVPVLCKDCKFSLDGGICTILTGDSLPYLATEPDHFCSHGERRTDNG